MNWLWSRRAERVATWLAAVALLVALLTGGRVARGAPAGWVEAHLTGHDTRLSVTAAGAGRLETSLTVRVLAGALRSVTVGAPDDDLAFDPIAQITSEDGRASTGAVARDKDGVVRVHIDDPKGLRKGTYVVRVAATLDVVRRMTPDGALWRLAFTEPPFSEGVDGVRVVFDLPAAQTEPCVSRATTQAGVAEGEEPGVLSTLRRLPDRDELELVRPHVPRGERASWSIRVDPKAFPEVRDPWLRPPPQVAKESPQGSRPWVHALLLVLLAVAFGWIVYVKSARFARALGASGASVPSLVPLPTGARAAAAGALLAFGVLAGAHGRLLFGAAFVALAAASAALRPPPRARRPRGPGAWRPVSRDEVMRPAQDIFDATTRRGAALALAVTSALVALGAWGARVDARAPALALALGCALMPVFATGTSAHLPPGTARSVALLERAAARLSGATWIARAAPGGSEADEVRLAVRPDGSMPGLTGIELAVAWMYSGRMALPRPELLVRVGDGTSAHRKLTALGAGRVIPGRSAEERVLRLAPEDPTPVAAAALVNMLSDALVERRTAEAPFQHGERRRARAKGVAAPVAAAA